MPTQNMGALAGIKVVDLSRVLAGPYATQILGDHGADIIKVEPPQGDETREWGPPFRDDKGERGPSSYYLNINRNKRGLALDLTKPEGREIVFRKVLVTHEGDQPGAEDNLDLLIKERPVKRAAKKSKGKKNGKSANRKKSGPENPRDNPQTLALKKWRLAEAKQQGVPAFRIFSDKVLAAIVDAAPFDADDLVAVPGISPRMATKYGAAILKVMMAHPG